MFLSYPRFASIIDDTAQKDVIISWLYLCFSHDGKNVTVKM